MKKNYLYLFLFVLISWGSTAQPSSRMTLQALFGTNEFVPESVEGLKWMKDGNYYSSLVVNDDNSKDIVKYATKDGAVVETLVRGNELKLQDGSAPEPIEVYDFSSDENKVLFSTGVEDIYRWSTKEVSYVFDRSSKKLTQLQDGQKISYATLSPTGNHVGYVFQNNLFATDLSNNSTLQITADGKKNEIINGFADWVYEEELTLSKSFFWSPDGKIIAYLKFNETDVPTYNMQLWNGLYPEDYTFKYPKAGEQNSVVTLHIYNLDTKSTIQVDLGSETDVYIARFQWLPDGSALSVIKLNRLQNQLEILHADSKSGSTKVAYLDKSDTYIDIDQVDDLTYLSDSKSFIVSSDRSGFKHLYHYAIDGKLINQITEGNWSVDHFLGINQKKARLYFTSTKESSIERHLYSIDLKGKKLKKISEEPGVHDPSFSHDFAYYIDIYSSASTAPKTVLRTASGKAISTLAENRELEEKAKKHGFTKTEFLQLALPTGDSLNGYMLKPLDFDPGKKYPLLMHVYGGPGSQRVMNRWDSRYWHQFLSQEGYIVVCIDNRGTGGKGKDFQHMTYKQLGKYETEDQIFAARYFADLSYIDEDRVGIWGWSYGGYMSLLSIMLGNDVFKTAISVAPVTSWRYYDTIYTERYLQRPQDNPEGYDAYSPLSHVDKLEGSLLLIHGTGDDNVHFQNSTELQNALIAAGKQFDSFYYPNRNHGIYGGNTRLHLYTMMTRFILDNL